jgi:hypothetical protein
MVRAYPTHTLEDTLAIAKAIHEHNAGLPFDRKLLARSLGTTPASSGYTMRLNSSAKYGLTEGGYNDDQISLTPRGQAIVAPRDSAEKQRSMIDAATQPDVFGKFYRLIDGKQMPEDAYARNLLMREFGIHQELTPECLEIIKANGLHVGIITDAGGSLGVKLPRAQETAPVHREAEPVRNAPVTTSAAVYSESAAQQTGKVFIGRSGDSEIVDALESVFEGFDIPYIVADAGPDLSGGLISPQVSSEMRKCTAAVLVISNEPSQTTESGKSSGMNSMIYQLGAASVLYGDRILIVKERDVELLFDTGSVRCAEFDHGNGSVDTLWLLRELHRAGVLRVTA